MAKSPFQALREPASEARRSAPWQVSAPPSVGIDEPSARPWTPLLGGRRARRARSLVERVARALAKARPESPSYAGGAAGMALFFAYLAADPDGAVPGGGEHSELAHLHLQRAVEGFSREQTGLGMHGGLAGIAWSLRHIEELLSGAADPGSTAEVDELLLRALDGWRGKLDLTYGLVGLGVYGLDHPCRATGDEILHQVLSRLEELAVEDARGIAWRAGVASGPGPQHLFDLGLAHGVPGMVGLLARAVAERRGGQRALRLLAGASRWLLSQRRPRDGGSAFPYTLPAAVSARSAWCYGDPGVASVLLAAAWALGDGAMETEAMAILERDRGRDPRLSGVVDAGLCHGAAGLGHIYNRLFQATGHPGFATTARRWLSRAMRLRRRGRGTAGYASYWPVEGSWRDQPGLLEGATGVGLALLAAVSRIEPGWDRPLLIAPRRPSRQLIVS